MGNQTKADRVLRFVRNLHLTGAFVGEPFEPRPWQEDIYRRLFETDEAGKLVVRDALIILPRKSGKTYFVATCVCLFLLGGSNDCILSVAASQEQARRLFEQVKSIIEQDPFLLGQCKITKDRIDHLPSGSYFCAVPANGDCALGHGPSVILVDEFCAWTKRKHKETYTALTTGSGARKNPLTIKISTQTTNRYTLAGEEFDLACRLKNRIVNGETIAEGDIERSNYLAVLYFLPADANWHDRKLWHKVCPGLGDWVSLDEYENKYRDACDFPSRVSDFQVYFLNMPASENARWMPPERWKSCEAKFDAADLLGRPCFAAVDIAPINDLSSCVLVFPFEEDGKTTLRVIQKSWLNKESIREKAATEVTPWRQWVDDGHLIETEGNTTDANRIFDDIIEMSKLYRIKLLAADQMHAFELGQRLSQAGLKVEWFKPWMSNFAPPTDRVMRMAFEKTIVHNGDPLLAYCVGNIRCKTDAHGNQMPDNDLRQRHEKVDAAIALIMAVGIWMREAGKPISGYALAAQKRKEEEAKSKTSTQPAR